jgi:hypothetical protein
MKFQVLLAFVGLVLFISPAFADTNYVKHPLRSADKVQDVTKPYQPSGWLISTAEEAEGDQTVDNAPETDLEGMTACYDDAFLRVDMHLYHPITYKTRVWYAVKFEYEDMVEYYTFYPDTKTFIYEKEEDGKVTDTKELTQDEEGDQAGVTSSGDQADSCVYLIINKENHIAGEKGKKYFLSTSFFSGYVDKNDKMHIADQTVTVDMQFKK